MFTGHTSLHAPQSDDAFGKSAFSGNRFPINSGESTAPTGPGYTLRYACPLACR